NVDAVHMNALALNNAQAVIGTVEQIDIAHGEPFASVGEQVVGPLISSEAAGGRSAANRRVKLKALTVNQAWALESHIRRFDRKEEGPIPIVQRGVTAERDRVNRVVLLAVGAAEKLARSSN